MNPMDSLSSINSNMNEVRGELTPLPTFCEAKSPTILLQEEIEQSKLIEPTGNKEPAHHMPKKSINVKENLKEIQMQRLLNTLSPTRIRLGNFRLFIVNYFGYLVHKNEFRYSKLTV